MTQASLPALLKQHFGYDSFRPLQEQIITDILEGHDVLALLPTGGGKSLCFQLPALINKGLTIVVSPLIALMKDQVDALQANGIAATFLNSSLTASQAQQRWKDLHNNQYRLLYVAPERLMMPEFLDLIQRWPLSLIAIDEAHCISEWGHDFRPEYRKLSQLRTQYPTIPLLAVTATATDRVRTDIIQQLGLKNPRRYTASFNRPNLTYRVWPKQKPYQQVLSFLKERPGESGIIYCLSRQSTEDLADQLTADGIKAQPYHAGLSAERRTHHQNLFLRDDIHVICATIAFGMGINKSNVRFVIHYDLPKNLEGYYQETGRAGRDGLPSDCVLLLTPNDARKQHRFIDQKPDPQEQMRARQQLQQMLQYAESPECRRVALLRYFGETTPTTCEQCDNCLSPRTQIDVTVSAQKFLSCVYRIREKSGFSVGLSHVIDVLRGSENEKVLRWSHQSLSTYSIGRDLNPREWGSLGRELIRLGFVSSSAGLMSTLELTEKGFTALKERLPIHITQPLLPSTKKGSSSSTSRADSDLFNYLRQLRKQCANEQNVPAYIIFSDATLRDMARQTPVTLSEFSKISGVGQKKLAAFGELFTQEIRNFISQLKQEK